MKSRERSKDENQKKRAKDYLPWNEKFRPKTLNDIAHQKTVVAALRKSMETANLPHLLFYGPPGTGKTSTILAVARELYGPELMRARILELNASDERGIAIVRTKIKNFAKIAVGTCNLDPAYPNPPFKILILDEADSMTRDAQSALRRTMERWSKVTRFCLICNYVSRIIAPVSSRCAKFRFQSLPRKEIVGKLDAICKAESITASEDTYIALETVSGGDLRKAITYLQSASLMVSKGDPVTPENVKQVSVRIPIEFADKLFEAATSQNFQDLYNQAEEAVKEGMPTSLLLEELHDRVIQSTGTFSGCSMAEIVIQLANADAAVEDGADEFLQLLNVLSTIHRKTRHT